MQTYIMLKRLCSHSWSWMLIVLKNTRVYSLETHKSNSFQWCFDSSKDFKCCLTQQRSKCLYWTRRSRWIQIIIISEVNPHAQSLVIKNAWKHALNLLDCSRRGWWRILIRISSKVNPYAQSLNFSLTFHASLFAIHSSIEYHSSPSALRGFSLTEQSKVSFDSLDIAISVNTRIGTLSRKVSPTSHLLTTNKYSWSWKIICIVWSLF